MSIYETKIRYLRPRGGTTEVFDKIDAANARSAISLAKERILNNPLRRVERFVAEFANPVCKPEPERTFVLGATYDLNNGTRARVITTYRDGQGTERVVIENPANAVNSIVTVDEWLQLTEPKYRYRYYSMYPNGSIYEQTVGPVKYSSYPMDQLVQVKVTLLNGKVINKEFV